LFSLKEVITLWEIIIMSKQAKQVTTSMTLDNWLYAKDNDIVPAKILNRAVNDFRRWGFTNIRMEDVQKKRKGKEKALETTGDKASAINA
jgi:hypothetical protein